MTTPFMFRPVLFRGTNNDLTDRRAQSMNSTTWRISDDSSRRRSHLIVLRRASDSAVNAKDSRHILLPIERSNSSLGRKSRARLRFKT
jgi:hypothetical protein